MKLFSLFHKKLLAQSPLVRFQLSFKSCFSYAFFLFISCYNLSSSQAQGTFTGCLLTGTNVLYRSEYLATGYFSSKTGVTPLSASYCYWSQTVSNPLSCTVCTGPNSVTYNSSTGAFISCDTPVVGVRGTYQMIYCSLDNNLISLLVLSAFCGLFLIKRTSLIE